jgi:uncharacterized protein YcbK (DUF882 family)
MGDLSSHFSTAEFCCKHCGRFKIVGNLITSLEELRALGPEPIIINDGYRCVEHNQEVGGAPNSEHVRGMAADIRIQGLSLQQMYARAEQVQGFKNGGIGVYDEGFIHVDVRDGRARWARKGKVYLALDTLVSPVKETNA